MTTISTGTVTTSSTGTTYVTSTSSDLDTDALIEIAVAEYTDKIEDLETEVEENDAKIEAYEEFYGLLEDLQDALSVLKSITGYSSTDENIFESRTGTLSSDGTDAEALIDVTIEDGAAEGSYEIVVVQEATEMSVTSATIENADEELGYSGEFTIGLDGDDYEAVTITVTSDMTLEDIADAINEESETSGVEASVLKVSETEYQLIITGTETNQEIVVSTTDGGTLLSDLGFTDGSDNFLEDQISQVAQGSIITLNGTTITRDDNTYDDLIDGVTIDIVGASESTTISLEIENDTSSALEAIEAFVDSYNALREFVILNQTVTDGEVDEDALLFSDTLLETLSYNLQNYLSSSRSSTSEVQTILDLGIEFDDDNYLEITDSEALEDALLDNFDDVMAFFTTDVEISDSSLGLITNDSTQSSLDFEMVITLDEDGDVDSVTVDGSSAYFTVSGSTIKGVEGTIYEGLTFVYAGDEDTTVSISMTGGLADQMYNMIDLYSNSSDGLIQDEIEALEEDNDDIEEEIEELEEKAEEVEEELIDKYSAMEVELQALDTLLNQVRSLLGIESDD